MSDSDDRSSLERPLEALVFAPLGFVLEARQMYPRFVDRGRNQILLARLVGRYATRQAMTSASGVLERNAGPAGEVLRLVGLISGDDDGGAAPAAPRPSAPGPAPAEASDPAAGPAPEDGSVAGTGTVEASAPSSDGADADVSEVATPVDVPDPAVLAIPDYDSLAASQVVPRLDALSDDELEDVRRYEAGVRGRKTILAKIAQLQAD